jgi:hypothetical protein
VSVASSPYPAHLFNPGLADTPSLSCGRDASATPVELPLPRLQPSAAQLAALSVASFAARPALLAMLRAPHSAQPRQVATTAYPVTFLVSPGRLWYLQLGKAPSSHSTAVQVHAVHASPGKLLQQAYAALGQDGGPLAQQDWRCALLHRLAHGGSAAGITSAATATAPAALAHFPGAGAPLSDPGAVAAALACWGAAAAPLLPTSPLQGRHRAPQALPSPAHGAGLLPKVPSEASVSEHGSPQPARAAQLPFQRITAPLAGFWGRLVPGAPRAAHTVAPAASAGASSSSGESARQQSLSPQSAARRRLDASELGSWLSTIWR